MGRVASFIEKIIISLLVTAVIAVVKQFFPPSSVFSELSLYSGKTLLLGPPLCFLVITTGIVYIALSLYISATNLWNPKLGRVCNDFRFLSGTHYYASNGYAKYKFMRMMGTHCLELELQNYSKEFGSNTAFTSSADCGVVFSKLLGLVPFYKGYMISDKARMRFEVMGENGGEQVGLAFKNTHGHEMKFSLDKFIPGQIDKGVWKVADVDMSEYSEVTRSAYDKAFLENFSIFTNSNLSKDKKVVIYLRNIEFTRVDKEAQAKKGT